MKVNPYKSKAVHFRPPRVPCTSHHFNYNNNDIEIVTVYKYPGLLLDYSVTSNILAASAGRALGGLYSKFKQNKGFGFPTYTKLYESCVTPVLDYCSGVWGFNKLDRIDTVQHRAIRLFLGVHRFAPNKAINADMGWVSSRVRGRVVMLRLWNRFAVMDQDSLSKHIFN